MWRLLLLMTPALLLLACGDSGEATESAGADAADVAIGGGDLAPVEDTATDDTSSPLDVAADEGPPTDASEDATTVEPDLCAAELSFTAGPELPMARDHHVTFVSESSGAPTLYVMGGNTYATVLSDVSFARIAEDGSLDAWQSGVSLPSPRAGEGYVLDGDRVFLLGGRSPTFLASVITATIQSDGDIDAWTDAGAIPEGRFHLSAARSGSHVYAIGGLDPTGYATDTVFTAEIDASGELGAFAATTAMPSERSHHASFVAHGYLYVAGGLLGTPFDGSETTLDDVARAPIEEDGSLGSWSAVGGQGAPLSTHSAVALDGCVYLLAGLVKVGVFTFRNLDVMRLPMGPGGELGEPAPLATQIPSGRGHLHQAPRWNGALYLVGGSSDHQVVTGTVDIGRLTAP